MKLFFQVQKKFENHCNNNKKKKKKSSVMYHNISATEKHKMYIKIF